MNPNQIERIVVCAPSWLGDAVMSLPALRALRSLFPVAHITLACRPGTADVFIDARFIDEVLLQKPLGVWSTFANASAWRQRGFDLAVLFPNSFAAAATALLARVPARIGYATDSRGAVLTHALQVPAWKNQRHESFYYLNIVAELERILFGTVRVTQTEPSFDLEVSAERKRDVRRRLHDYGASPDRPLAVLCPGSINSRAKRWPAERYAALSDRLSKSGVTVALIGSSAELDAADEVCREAQSSPISLVGKTTVAEVIALISIADVLVTNDTGPAHLGAALGTPTLVIFGPTNPLTTYPFSENAEIIRHAPDCAPCMLRDCPIDHRCMTAISPDEVFERATALMHAHQALTV